MLDWQPLDSAPLDRPLMLFCPGASNNTHDVLMGCWLPRLSIWELLPYGTTQPVTLYPSRWAEIPAGPVKAP